MSVNKKIIEAEATVPIPDPPADSFNVLLYTGDRPTNAGKTGVGFQPDLIFIKGRTQTDFWSVLDSTRGANVLSCDATQAESSFSGFTFDTDGFTVGSSGQANSNGTSYVSYHWRANGGTTSSNTDGTVTSTVQAKQSAGFSIVTFTSASSGSSYTVGHGLNSTPELIIFKYRNLTSNWPVYVAAAGGNKFLYLDLTNAVATGTNNFMTSVSSSTMTFGTDSIGGYPLVAYCFHSVSGYSKIGSYVGNGSTNGPTVTTGFQPDWIMIKRTDTADEWYIYDSVRSTSNSRTKILLPNSNIAELDNAAYSIDFLSNGFQPKSASSTATNANGGTYIYMAFKISS